MDHRSVSNPRWNDLGWLWRLATRQLRGLPNYLIIGVQKGGTTSLQNYLEQHPRVGRPLTKEINYFSDTALYQKGEDWYRAHFPLLRPFGPGVPGALAPRMLGEATPKYVFFPDAIERISRDLPDTKLILLLRNPAERAYSHYRMKMRNGIGLPPWEDYAGDLLDRLNSDPEAIPEIALGDRLETFNVIARGLYVFQVQRLLQHIPPANVRILSSEDFFERPEEVYRTVLGFLGLPDFAPELFPALNVGGYERPDGKAMSRLAAFYEPYNRELYALLGRDFGWA